MDHDAKGIAFTPKPPADFDRDIKNDVGIYRDGTWSIKRSTDGGTTSVGWGGPTWEPVQADYDGDGKEDVFLSQNFFAMNSETGRNDAGRGLWLKGDGSGGLTPVPGQESGVKVYGEQRGAALCDYDGDGRLDLVVTQNGAETKLYHNVRGKPGLRVRLQGPPGNPEAIGAQIRLRFGQTAGPVRELHAGSGYRSQDSAILVLIALLAVRTYEAFLYLGPLLVAMIGWQIWRFKERPPVPAGRSRCPGWNPSSARRLPAARGDRQVP